MSKLKERLFGLIVVIALGVIFVPMLLENTQSPKSSVMQDVPAVPVAKNELDKSSKPEVLATLKESPKEEQVTHDENQPIADRPDQGVKPGTKEDLKIKEKLAMAQEKAEQERLAAEKAQQEKAQLEKAAAAKAAEEKRAAAALAEQQQLAALHAKQEQEKQEQEKLVQVKRDEQQRREAQLAEQKLAEDKRRQAEITQAKLEQEQLEKERLARQKEQQDLQQARQAEQSTLPTKSVEETPKETVKKPAKSVKAPSHSGWVVQMGSFAEQQNASALLKKLRAAGYPAFTRHVNRNGMHLTVVMVGPHARREEADRLCSTLAMKFQIDGIIVRYEPR